MEKECSVPNLDSSVARNIFNTWRRKAAHAEERLLHAEHLRVKHVQKEDTMLCIRLITPHMLATMLRIRYGFSLEEICDHIASLIFIRWS